MRDSVAEESMSIKRKMQSYFRAWRNLVKHHSVQDMKDQRLNQLAAELIRNTHSIEKGLSIETPRLSFGQKKQLEMMDQIEILSQSDSMYHREACEMALCAIQEYLEYHTSKGYSDEFCEKLKSFLMEKRALFPDTKKGGTLCLKKSELNFDVPEIERLFDTRHSIRDFDQTEVCMEDLKRALELAQKAPSACNRQGVRVYVLDKEKSRDYMKQLSGIGGFAEAVDKYILVTGKTSAYRLEEDNQFIVSASIYAAYLTLTLHLYGIGACVVQRPVVWNAEWAQNRKVFGIPEDEQIVCLLAVGNLKESCKVPVSYRMKNEEMIRFL